MIDCFLENYRAIKQEKEVLRTSGERIIKQKLLISAKGWNTMKSDTNCKLEIAHYFKAICLFSKENMRVVPSLRPVIFII